MITMEQHQKVRRDALQECEVPSNCIMSAERSVKFIKTFCNTTEFPLETFVRDIDHIINKDPALLENLRLPIALSSVLNLARKCCRQENNIAQRSSV